MLRNLFLVIKGLLLLLFIFHCSSRLVPKEKVIEYNEILLERIYVLKEDLVFSNGEKLKKGTKVRVYVESTPSLFKVKCYPVEEQREYAIGKLAIYKINETVDKKELFLEDIEEILKEKFDLYVPDTKKRK